MLATTRCTDHSSTTFMPHVSSPLKPRSPNIYGRSPYTYMSSPDAAETVQNEQQKCGKTDWGMRAKKAKKAPSPKQDELKERRRSIFLKKVREGREAGRWEQRGEDMMRLDFVQRQKEWEAEQASQAPEFSFDAVEEDDHRPPSASATMQISQHSAPDEEADEVARREQEEMDALLAYMPQPEKPQWYGEEWEDYNEQAPEHAQNIWSDDDDYDALFFDVMDQSASCTEQQGEKQHAQHVTESSLDEQMDLS